MATVHEQKKPFVCDICGKVFGLENSTVCLHFEKTSACLHFEKSAVCLYFVKSAICLHCRALRLKEFSGLLILIMCLALTFQTFQANKFKF